MGPTATPIGCTTTAPLLVEIHSVCGMVPTILYSGTMSNTLVVIAIMQSVGLMHTPLWTTKKVLVDVVWCLGTTYHLVVCGVLVGVLYSVAYSITISSMHTPSM